MKSFFAVPLILSFSILAGCGTSYAGDSIPKWVALFIKNSQKDPVGNPPLSITRYTYQGKIVYYVPPQCCDQYSRLFIAEGAEICAPDGGMDGRGDGKCPDFYDVRKDEKLIWEDSRGK